MTLLPAGRVLEGRYRIESVLGRGAMGVVYLAVEQAGGRKVAIKELALANPRTSMLSAFEEQFRLEASILKQLNHPGLPALHEAFVSGGHHYLVMDFIDGQTLEALRSQGPIEETLALQWTMQICGVLECLHSHSPPIVFRDLKPSNVMISGEGRLYLLDFGISKLFDPAAGLGTPAVVRGAFTPGFAAPEQFSGATTDARTDIYALGATLYFMLSGQAPPQAMHLQMGTRQLAPLPAAPAVTELVGEMMRSEPLGRPQSVRELADRLHAMGVPTSSPEEPPAPARAVSRWMIWLAWVLVILALLAALSRLASADPLPPSTLIVDASPSPCRVYAVGPPDRFIGLSGQPLALEKRDFKEDRSLRLRLESDGYVDSYVRVNGYQMQGPEVKVGPCALTSESCPLASWTNLVRGHGPALLLTTCLMILAGGMAVRFLRPYRRYREAVRATVGIRSIQDAETLELVGRNFGGYVLTERLGRGGTATVYRGEATGREVAVKVIDTRGEPEDSLFLRRIRREIRILTSLEHPCIVQYLDSGEADGMFYIIMQRIQGSALRSEITSDGLPVERFRHIFRAVLEGVEYVHSHGITHRDLKPENIMICGEEVRVIDFGLARGDLMSVVTQDSHVMGTPHYMSPEQFDGNVCSPLADQYSLGVVAYEMLTGKPPFDSDEVLNLCYQHCYQHSQAIRSSRPEVPADIERIVHRMLSKSPAQRFPSLRDILAIL